jgi:hypothetical protein
VLQQTINEYENYIHAGKLNVKSLASVIHDRETKETISSLIASATVFKRTELCPLCAGKGCQRCSERGYIDAQNAEYIRKDIKRGLASVV